MIFGQSYRLLLQQKQAYPVTQCCPRDVAGDENW